MALRWLDAREAHKGRSYLGEEIAAPVTAWLNGEERPGYHSYRAPDKWTTQSAARILKLINDLVALLKMVESVERDHDWWTSKGIVGPEGFWELMEEVVNTAFERYPTIPYFFPMRGRNWIIQNRFYCVGRKKQRKLPWEEHVAAYSVIELARLGLLNRISQCACSKWFFGRFQHQRSCSATCRQKLYQKTETYKSSRREYMRNYYRLQKSGNVK